MVYKEDKIDKFFKYTIELCMFLIVIISLSQVLGRYLLNTTIPWALDLAVVAGIWMVWLGSALEIKKHGHIKMQNFVERLKPKAKLLILVILDLLISIFLIIFLISSVNLVLNLAGIRFASMNVSVAYMYLSAPFSAFFMLLFTIKDIGNDIKNYRKERIS